MKKKLFLVTLIVASLSMFTSCDKTTDLTVVKISLDATSFASGAAVTGGIVALGELQSVTLLKEGTSVSGWPVTTFATGSKITGSASAGYAFRLLDLADGSYSMRATDKSGAEDNVTFTVATVGSLKTITTATVIYCTLSDGSGKSTCASADGTTYEPKTATATQQATVDFVYFNLSGTALAIYSPSSIPTALTNAFTTWTAKNTTKFAKTTTITYDAATYASVKTAADAATETSVTGLATGTVVVFKTAAGKVGIFKVNTITAGFGGSDNVNINIKVQN
jgi:hypothetical protein